MFSCSCVFKYTAYEWLLQACKTVWVTQTVSVTSLPTLQKTDWENNIKREKKESNGL